MARCISFVKLKLFASTPWRTVLRLAEVVFGGNYEILGSWPTVNGFMVELTKPELFMAMGYISDFQQAV
jgi:hypothetical protein